MIWSENRFPLFGIMHWGRSMFRILAIAAIAASMPLAATAARSCPGNPDALGTERVLAVDADSTPQVLNALKHEGVRATFFLLGRNVEAHPEIARRERAEGHSLGQLASRD